MSYRLAGRTCGRALTQAPRRVDDLPAVWHVDQVEQVDVAVAEATHARDPAAEVVDPDLNRAVGGILAAALPVGGRVDHVPRGQRLQRVRVITLDPPAALDQFGVKRPFHPVRVAVEPAFHVVHHGRTDRILIIGDSHLALSLVLGWSGWTLGERPGEELPVGNVAVVGLVEGRAAERSERSGQPDGRGGPGRQQPQRVAPDEQHRAVTAPDGVVGTAARGGQRPGGGAGGGGAGGGGAGGGGRPVGG